MSQGERQGKGLDSSRLEAFIASPRRAVWTMSLPMMAGMLLHVAYSIVDTAFVGRLGSEALAGMTLVFPLFFVLIALANGIGSGISVLVAQAVGRRDAEAAERSAGTALSLGIAFGLLFTLLGLSGGRWLLHQLGAANATADQAWLYFSVIVLMAPVTLVSAFLRFVLNGEGDARTPMTIMAASTILNIVLDPIFIFVLDMGIRGAAIATALGQLFTLSVFLYLLMYRRNNVVKIRARYLWPDLATVVRVLRFGLPASANQLIMSLSAMLMNRVVVHFGDAALAGTGAATRLDALVAMPVLGLASGATAVIAMFAGAGRVDLVRKTTLYTYYWAVGLATVVGLLVFTFSRQVIGGFIQDPQAIAVGRHYLSYMVFAYPMMGIGMTSGRLFLGLGYPLLSMLITSVRLILVAVPIAWISVFVFDAPIDGVWSGFLLGGISSALTALIIVYNLVWRRDPTLRARHGAGH